MKLRRAIVIGETLEGKAIEVEKVPEHYLQIRGKRKAHK